MMGRNWLFGMVMSVATGASALPTNASDASWAVIADLSGTHYDQVLDIRDISQCTEGSLPQARCLPLAFFVDANGTFIDFHALRWLLGTAGLQGRETVLVVGATAGNTQTVGKLLHQAGQHRVLLYAKPFAPTDSTHPGEPRSFTRETVYTAPMRGTL